MLVLVVAATVAEEEEEEGEEGDSSTCPLGANATRCHPTSKSSSEAAAASTAPPPPSPPAPEGIPPCLDLCGWRLDQKPPPVPSNITEEEARAVIRRCCS